MELRSSVEVGQRQSRPDPDPGVVRVIGVGRLPLPCLLSLWRPFLWRLDRRRMARGQEQRPKTRPTTAPCAYQHSSI